MLLPRAVFALSKWKSSVGVFEILNIAWNSICDRSRVSSNATGIQKMNDDCRHVNKPGSLLIRMAKWRDGTAVTITCANPTSPVAEQNFNGVMQAAALATKVSGILKSSATHL